MGKEKNKDKKNIEKAISLTLIALSGAPIIPTSPVVIGPAEAPIEVTQSETALKTSILSGSYTYSLAQYPIIYGSVRNHLSKSDPPVDDAFLDRISDPAKLNKIIKEAEEVYSESPTNLQYQNFAEYLRDFYSEIRNTLSDPKALASIFVEVAILSPIVAMGLGLAEEMVKKFRKWARKEKNDPAKIIANQMGKLINYFEKVAKSRLAEIVEGTGLSEKQVSALLKLGPFSHEPGCFWRPAKFTDSKEKGILFSY